MTTQKYIALIDCDSFFVSCERKLNPELKGIPVSVVSGERGCVIARSREAKALGIPMGIPLFRQSKNILSVFIYQQIIMLTRKFLRW